MERQGADRFFGATSLDVADLIRTVDGRGVINILSLADMQEQPQLYSAFLMWLLGQFYYRLPAAKHATLHGRLPPVSEG